MSLCVCDVCVCVLHCCFKLTSSDLILDLLSLLMLRCVLFFCLSFCYDSLFFFFPSTSVMVKMTCALVPLLLWLDSIYIFVHTWTTDEIMIVWSFSTKLIHCLEIVDWAQVTVLFCFLNHVFVWLITGIFFSNHNNFAFLLIRPQATLFPMRDSPLNLFCKRLCFAVSANLCFSSLFVSSASFNLSWPPEEGIAASARTKHPLPLFIFFPLLLPTFYLCIMSPFGWTWPYVDSHGISDHQMKLYSQTGQDPGTASTCCHVLMYIKRLLLF